MLDVLQVLGCCVVDVLCVLDVLRVWGACCVMDVLRILGACCVVGILRVWGACCVMDVLRILGACCVVGILWVLGCMLCGKCALGFWGGLFVVVNVAYHRHLCCSCLGCSLMFFVIVSVSCITWQVQLHVFKKKYY